MPVIKKCVYCGKEYKTRPSRAEKRRYCSNKCQGKAITNLVIKKCIVCQTEFKVHNNKWRKDAKYCSQQCKGKDQSNEKHWNYKGPGNRLEDDPAHMKARRRNLYLTSEKLKNNIRKGKMKRERNLIVEHHFNEWTELLKKHDNICFYCGVRMTKTPGIKQRTRDHMIPISKGGSDKIENIVPACRSCNSKKGKLTFDEFLEKIGKVKPIIKQYH
ncbi:HNH endonuclease [Bacillus sp. FJAT-22090]|uniref:HNH endonuclease n=1 Tax=Bacillus sp. FJAT-22090 TaxID=1581038 RepID=UPI0006AF3312|nr:HNH endonuclease [Bacillus sp. FJAT-22090]